MQAQCKLELASLLLHASLTEDSSRLMDMMYSQMHSHKGSMLHPFFFVYNPSRALCVTCRGRGWCCKMESPWAQLVSTGNEEEVIPIVGETFSIGRTRGGMKMATGFKPCCLIVVL